MRIAMLMPYLPYPPDSGGKIRSFYFLKKAASRHEVDLIAFQNCDEPEGLDAIEQVCSSVRLVRVKRQETAWERIRRLLSPMPRSVSYFSTSSSIAEVQQWLRCGNYDLVHVDEICMAPYVVGLAGLPMVIARQKVDFDHYREMATARRWGLEKLLDSIEYVKLLRYERTVGSHFRDSVVCSERDAHLFRMENKHVSMSVIPNGVDTQFFSPQETVHQASGPTLIYMGTMFYYPNINAVSYFFEQIFPRIVARIPTVKVLLVGHNPPKEMVGLQKKWNVRVTGSVPDVRPYLASSTAMILPLRLGGGTRLKIMEAMAMGIPVISTSIGCEGLAVTDGHDILVADDPAAFAERTVAALLDEDLRTRISSNARSLAHGSYSWDSLGEKLLTLYDDIIRSATVAS